MARRNEVEKKELGRYEIKLPRELNRDDYIAANVHATNNPADPFAYARALSRLRYYLCLPSDLLDKGIGV